MLPKPPPLAVLVTAPAPALVDGDDGRSRCGWVRRDPQLAAYHDDEWGVPLHGDAALFEKLSLEGFQSGLSWLVVLRKRERFRSAFAGFDPRLLAGYGDDDVERLLTDAGIIRNRLKIQTVLANARALAALLDREGDGALDRLVWSFAAAAREEHVAATEPAEVPAQTAVSADLAAALKGVGLRFVGPITMYALMQSGGLVDDHLTGCFRHAAGHSAGR